MKKKKHLYLKIECIAYILSFLLAGVYSKELVSLVVLLAKASRTAGVGAGNLGDRNPIQVFPELKSKNIARGTTEPGY